MGPEKSIAEKAIKAYEIASLVNRCLLAVQSELAKETQTDDIKMVNQVISVYSNIFKSVENLSTNPKVIAGIIAIANEFNDLDKRISKDLNK
jgi:deoxyadenosine/deoxycytidine kinase